MNSTDDINRSEILARLAISREELRQLLDPPRVADGASAAHAEQQGFPRSRTMQMLMTGRGLGTVGAAAAGLLLARPSWALSLLRLVPASAVGRVLLARALGAFKNRAG